MSDDGYSALARLRYRDHDDDLRVVVAVLKRIAGEFPPPSQDDRAYGLFLLTLAHMIDPAPYVRDWPKLVVKHTDAGAPKARNDSRLGHFLWAHIDVLKEKNEAVLADAERKYGVKKTRALDALATERATVAGDPGHYVPFAGFIVQMHERGVLEGYFED